MKKSVLQLLLIALLGGSSICLAAEPASSREQVRQAMRHLLDPGQGSTLRQVNSAVATTVSWATIGDEQVRETDRFASTTVTNYFTQFLYEGITGSQGGNLFFTADINGERSFLNVAIGY